MNKENTTSVSVVNREDVMQIINTFRDQPGALIPLLQAVQKKYSYVPKEAVELIADELGMFPVDIYGVLTFYAQFYLEPRGRHTIRVCEGTACYIMGGKDILDRLKTDLGVEESKTTADGRFYLETVACLGCCGMAPAMMIDEDFYGNCTAGQLDGILKKYE
ncbi:MAG: NADH-quinone oxidoreductase subunit NuoE [Kiritimatiellia bacterium]